MSNYASAPDFSDLSSYIAKKWIIMKPLAAEWTEIARKAIQHVPYNERRLVEIETYINPLRSELRIAVLVASEHFTDQQLLQLQKHAGISKTGWRALRKDAPLTLKNGFSLLVY